jgi:hypothetical protein
MWNTFSIAVLLAWTENVCVNLLHIVALEVQVYSYKINSFLNCLNTHIWTSNHTTNCFLFS